MVSDHVPFRIEYVTTFLLDEMRKKIVHVEFAEKTQALTIFFRCGM